MVVLSITTGNFAMNVKLTATQTTILKSAADRTEVNSTRGMSLSIWF